MSNLQVLFLSIFGGNPYKKSLISHLAGQEVTVCDEEAIGNTFFLLKGLSTHSYDVLHLHTIHHFLHGRKSLYSSKNSLALRLNEFYRSFKFFVFITQIRLLKLFGTKIIWTVHEWADKSGGKWGEITPKWAKVIGETFDGIITHCDSTRTQMIDSLSLGHKSEKVFVVPHANYIGTYKNEISQSEARNILKIPSENLVFILFGNIHKSKGFLEAIDSFRELRQDEICLLIVGNPAEKDLEEVIKDKTKDDSNIIFIPKLVPDEDIQIYLNACDCVIVPYKVSTTSGVTLLAMSFGKACIAPDIGFFNDVLDTTGSFLYNPSDPKGLFHAMEAAVDQRKCISDMGQHNLALVQPWSWDFMATKTAEVYQHCLNRSI